MSQSGRVEPEIVERERTIVRTSVIGIAANILLAAFKAVIGFVSNSIAVTLDAVNNLSDALSSIITIIGAKLGGKAPDRKHPLGHGRIEYLSSMIVSGIVLYAGITALIESIRKIFHPEEPDYAIVSLIIIAVAVVVKIVLGRYVKKQGEKVNSGALIASGSDASFDAILSASVLASAILYMTTHVSVEAYVGAVIAIMIIKAGIEMMSETLNDILGHRADEETTHKIKEILTEEPQVRGAYDLFMVDYGPNKNLASVHLELPETMTVDEVDKLTRRLEFKVFKETGVILIAVGVYAFNTTDAEVAAIRSKIESLVLAHEWVLQMHGFYAEREEKRIRFDVVLSFDIGRKDAMEILQREVQEAYPDYEFMIVPDVDISD
ncbi:MAG: cation transporter [Clostridia bacterium]|nr:cation transporter [Clostridia bacterium]